LTYVRAAGVACVDYFIIHVARLKNKALHPYKGPQTLLLARAVFALFFCMNLKGEVGKMAKLG
jgi:hypothetical protein